MSYSISKELFEAVMGFEVIEFYCRKEIQYYPADKERVRCIDWIPTLSGLEYNDFFFKCKEWAYSKGIEYMWSGRAIQYNDYYEPQFFCNIDWKKAKDFRANSEQQAVIDCCQWLLDNKDKQ